MYILIFYSQINLLKKVLFYQIHNIRKLYLIILAQFKNIKVLIYIFIQIKKGVFYFFF